MPGEHDVISDNGALYRERFAKKAVGRAGLALKKGVHFIGLNNVLNIREGGLGIIGAEQLDWLKKDPSRHQRLEVLVSCRLAASRACPP